MLALCLSTSAAAQSPPGSDWPAYGHDALGSRWSPLTQINRTNVAQLTVAWRLQLGEAANLPKDRRMSFEATPIVVDGTMYLSTPTGRVLAIDPETGMLRWKFDAKLDSRIHFGDFANRGVSTWLDSKAAPGARCARRIVYAVLDARVIELDAKDGKPCEGFGKKGTVDLRRGLRNKPFETAEYEETSPPAVVNDVIVVGSGVADNNRTDAASGEVRGFDARTGKLLWTWDPVPQDIEDPAFASWGGEGAHHTGAANVWSVIAADPERDVVILPTTSPSPDYWGGRRLGNNDYANSVIALKASTGQLLWHFQVVHHDLWDYDNASPPALVNIRKGDRVIPAVIQANKNGMLYVLNRTSGVPIFPVEERPVPASTVPGEQASPTQPFSTLPALSPQRLDPDSIASYSPGIRAACQAQIKGLRNEGVFTPPSLEGSVVIPSNVGGAHWGGVAFDPDRQIVVVPVNHLAVIVQLIPAEGADEGALHQEGDRLGYETTRMHGTPYYMRRRFFSAPDLVRCTPPPYGALVAIDLKTATKAWEVPLGVPVGLTSGLPTDSQALAAFGSANLGGAIATAGGLVFIAATPARAIRAFDIETGKKLWEGALPAGAKATPMTYAGRDGRQYVVIMAAGDGDGFGRSDEVVAFALR